MSTLAPRLPVPEPPDERVERLRGEVAELKGEVAELKGEVAELKGEDQRVRKSVLKFMHGVRDSHKLMKAQLAGLAERFDEPKASRMEVLLDGPRVMALLAAAGIKNRQIDEALKGEAARERSRSTRCRWEKDGKKAELKKVEMVVVHAGRPDLVTYLGDEENLRELLPGAGDEDSEAGE